MLGLILAGASLAVGLGKDIAGAAAQNKQAAAERAAAIASRNESFRQLSLQESQQQDATAQAINAIDRQGQSQDALARVSAGEAGVAGASVDALAGDLAAQAANAKIITQRNLDMTIAQIQEQKRGIATEAKNRINGAQPASNLALGLDVLGTGLSFASSRIAQKAPGGPSSARIPRTGTVPGYINVGP